MSLLRITLGTGSLLLLLFSSTTAQNTVEERLDRIEARLDTLFLLHRDVPVHPVSAEIIADSSNLLWGVSGPTGTLRLHE